MDKIIFDDYFFDRSSLFKIYNFLDTKKLVFSISHFNKIKILFINLWYLFTIKIF